MRVVVTGGTGFVGLNIVEALAAAGHEVLVLDLAPPPPAFETAAEFRRLDVTDDKAFAAAIAGSRAEALVLGAAITADAARERVAAEAIARVNLVAALTGLRAARDAGLGRVVFLSSASVYGENANATPELDEVATPALPDSLYAATKYAGERAALRFHDAHGLDAIALRLSAVFGPWERDTGVRDTLSQIQQATRAALQGEAVVMDRDARRDWVYAPDVGRAVALAVEAAPSPGPRLCNIGPGMEWTVGAWCQRLAARLPGFAWRIGEPATIRNHGAVDRHPLAVARAREALGFEAAFDIEAAFTHYLAWLDSPGHGFRG